MGCIYLTQRKPISGPRQARMVMLKSISHASLYTHMFGGESIDLGSEPVASLRTRIRCINNDYVTRRTATYISYGLGLGCEISVFKTEMSPRKRVWENIYIALSIETFSGSS